MHSLVRQFGWGKAKITVLEAILNQLVWIDNNVGKEKAIPRSLLRLYRL